MVKKTTEADHAANFMAGLHSKSEELYKVRMWLNDREENFKKETEAMYAKEAELKAQLLGNLNTLGLKSVKVKSGDSFYITKSSGVEVLNETLLVDWAIKNKIAKPDSKMLKEKLKSMIKKGEEIPTFVKFYEKDSIGVRRASQKEE